MKPVALRPPGPTFALGALTTWHYKKSRESAYLAAYLLYSPFFDLSSVFRHVMVRKVFHFMC